MSRTRRPLRYRGWSAPDRWAGRHHRDGDPRKPWGISTCVSLAGLADNRAMLRGFARIGDVEVIDRDLDAMEICVRLPV